MGLIDQDFGTNQDFEITNNLINDIISNINKINEDGDITIADIPQIILIIYKTIEIIQTNIEFQYIPKLIKMIYEYLEINNYINFKDTTDINKVKTAVDSSITLLMTKTNTNTNTKTGNTSNKSFLSKLINPTIIALIGVTIYLKIKVKTNNNFMY